MIVEFGMLAGIIVVITVAVIEFSLVVFDYARAAEATRAATRQLVMLTPVGNLNDLATTDVECRSTGGATSCVGGALLDAASFDSAVATLQATLPVIQAENVVVEYSYSGIGALDSGGYKPYISVRLENVSRPYILLGAFLGGDATITLPAFKSTLLGNPYMLI